MLKAFVIRRIETMERRWRYDASYLKFLVRADFDAARRFTVLTRLVNPRAAPAAALAAAGIAATLQEDCGPCVQISVDMAAATGVKPQVLRAILAGDEAGMGEAAALAWRFARASLARDMAAADPLRDEILSRWGEKGLAALSLAIVTGRMYPTLKYALGYGKTCARVEVAGEAAPVRAPALAA